MWTRSTGSGHKKRQCTVQLTVFADGVQCIKSLLIFKCTGKRIPDKKEKQYDQRDVVKFQENTWRNDNLLVRYLWNLQSTFFSANAKRSRLLLYDQQKAQTTKKVKEMLQNECKTTLALFPPETTSKVQPLDVSVNSEFKNSVDRLVAETMTRNPDNFPTGKVTASGKFFYTMDRANMERDFSPYPRCNCSLFYLVRNRFANFRTTW